jgi:signal transduction histidine kinase
VKIQTKTTILFTVLISVTLVVLETVVYFFINKFSQNDFYKRVELRAKISAKFRFEQNDVSTIAYQEIQREYLEKLPHEEAVIINADSIQTQLATLAVAPIDKEYINRIIAANGETVHKQVKFRHYAGILYKDETGNFIIIKSATNEYGRELMAKLRYIKIVTLVFFIIVSFIIGHYFSKRSFRPFSRIIGKAKQINENNMHLRLEAAHGNDEISSLSRTFNEMLDRLETAFETQNNFISNASHELRTPLTAITCETEFALSKERTPEDYKQSLQHIALQTTKLQNLIHGLLSLAQTGFDGKKIHQQPMRIDELLYEVKANIDNIVTDNKLELFIPKFPADEERLMITGSPELLKIAVSNVALNACKYSGNQKVLLKLLLEDGTAKIIVEDKGIGIPAAELKYIYDPFFRASNTNTYEGFGIGMPLTRNIIRLHKGIIEVASGLQEGTTVTITLPCRTR